MIHHGSLNDLDGHSIQIVDPFNDHGDGTNWKASPNIGGSRIGVKVSKSGKLYFSASGKHYLDNFWTKADPDNDGINNFSEYALGYSLNHSSHY